MHASGYSTTYQAEIDYRRDRIKSGIGERQPRRWLRHRTPRSTSADGTAR